MYNINRCCIFVFKYLFTIGKIVNFIFGKYFLIVDFIRTVNSFMTEAVII